MTSPAWRRLLSLFLAALALDLVLIQPNHPAAVGWDALLLFPLELPLILLALIVLGHTKAGTIFRIGLIIFLSVIVVLKAADYVMFTALNRGFNLVADMPLIGSFYDLLVGAVGIAAAIGAVIGAILFLVGVIATLWWATGVWSFVKMPGWGQMGARAGAVVCAVVIIVDIGAKMQRWETDLSFPGTAFTGRIAVEQIQSASETFANLRLFNDAAKVDPFRDASNLFDNVDRDVIIVFVESYGRTSLDTPLYADLHRKTLRSAQAELEALGLAMSSTILASPTKGGQSWLAHATFANGLWIADQTSYRAALASGRQTLFHIAQQSGFETAAVMPQITLDWPEAHLMGFDTVLAAADLGYQGTPFNWITMPDQFTFAAMDRILRDRPRDHDTRFFIQVATGSSHAPWVPVPEVIDWSDLGDGSVFDPIVAASDPPRIIWQDNDRVRAQYRLAVDYALQTVFAYAALHADDPPLMIVIGDHQAAGFVAMDDRPDVPMHVIGPKALVDIVADSDFHTGLIPPKDTRVRQMDLMRAHLLRALSSIQIAEITQ